MYQPAFYMPVPLGLPVRIKLIAALLAVSVVFAQEPAREIPEKLQTEHALASLDRVTAYMQHLLDFDKKLRAIEEEMKKDYCG